jgi:nucleoside 2-deoxyribosyltransferase
MIISYARCPVCRFPSVARDAGRETRCECLRCGIFSIKDSASALIRDTLSSDEQRLNLSSYLFENQGTLITRTNLPTLIPTSRPTVSQQTDKLLRAIARSRPAAGNGYEFISREVSSILHAFNRPDQNSLINVDPEDLEISRRYLQLMAAAWTHREKEIYFLLEEVLTTSRKFLSKNGFHYAITADGWESIEKSIPQSESLEAFVAMSFDLSLEPIFQDLIKPGIEECGFRAIRVDRTEHVNKIDDEIISRIRQARFVVADFTEHKNGVYFEAGFAFGLGIPVVWMCRDEDLGKSHFDTRQYNAVVWNESELDDARRRLAIRIGAVVGRAGTS